tara:strand:- start:589 stop:1131 length:543 start_codon:yes stop_codon:yes gene_type:complete
MAHKQQFEFVEKVKSLFPSYFRDSLVYDFGSLDINGNNKVHFEGGKYVGIDIGEGKNVDVVSLAHEFVADKKADVVISTEMLEHDMYWRKSLEKMLSVLKPNGLLVITCATTGRREHGTSQSSDSDSPFTSQIEGWSDYYKNLTIEDVASVLHPPKNFEPFFENATTKFPCDYQFYGIKK